MPVAPLSVSAFQVSWGSCARCAVLSRDIDGRLLCYSRFSYQQYVSNRMLMVRRIIVKRSYS